MDGSPVSYAGFWRRAGALLIDNILLALPLLFMAQFHTPHPVQTLVYQSACLAYFVLCESAPAQATPGKRLMGIYVATAELLRLPPVVAVARYVVWILPFVPSIVFELNPDYIRILETQHNLHAAGDHNGLRALLNDPASHAVMVNYLVVSGGSIAAWIVWCVPSMILSKEKTGLHDLVTGTRVFRR